jgi:predicted neutral ceramidase superfamily lipid hydrolase
MDNKRLIDCIKETTLSAMAKLEKAEASCRSVTVPNVKVIGARQLEALCSLIDLALKRARKAVVPIFGGSGLLLMLLLMFV